MTGRPDMPEYITGRSEIAGSVAITWSPPAATALDPLPSMLCIHDAATGELIPVWAMKLISGDPVRGWHPATPLTVEITELLGEDAHPLRALGSPAVTDEYREHMRRVAARRGGRRIGELSREQCADLDAFQHSFTGRQFLTVTRTFTVAAMAFAGTREACAEHTAGAVRVPAA